MIIHSYVYCLKFGIGLDVKIRDIQSAYAIIITYKNSLPLQVRHFDSDRKSSETSEGVAENVAETHTFGAPKISRIRNWAKMAIRRQIHRIRTFFCRRNVREYGPCLLMI